MRKRLDAQGASPSVEIDDLAPDAIRQQSEQSLPDPISGGPGRKALGRSQSATAQGTAGDSEAQKSTLQWAVAELVPNPNWGQWIFAVVGGDGVSKAR